MKCFRHRDVDAVAICRACSKGICATCAVDLGHSVACRGACEAEASAIHDQILATRRTLKTQKRNRFLTPFYLGVMGLVFLYAGVVRESDPFNFMTALGSVLVVVAGVFAYINWKRAKGITSDGI